MNTTDLTLAAIINNAKTIDDLERLLQQVMPRMKIDIDSDGQIMICTGLYTGDGDTFTR